MGDIAYLALAQAQQANTQLSQIAEQIAGLDGGGSGLTVESKSANATITLLNDKFISCDATAAQVTITLPTAVGISGRKVTLEKTDASANYVIADGNGSETIDGELTYVLEFQYSAMTLVSDGANWHII